MIGLLTKIIEVRSPFHRAKNPYALIRFLPASIIDTRISACFDFKTQKGFVAIAEMAPANPDDFDTLKNELGLKPKNFFACA